jgi:cytidylate kinase
MKPPNNRVNDQVNDQLTEKTPVITIDGPSGSGKGTIAGLLAKHLGWHLLDSGALYRIVAAKALDLGVGLDDAAALASLADSLSIRFTDDLVEVDGEDLSLVIRTEAVSVAASQVAALPEVREAILQAQRAMCQPPGLVADGRDMGTVVFPGARLKIYLDASAEVRAERRYNQLKNKGLSVSLRALLTSLQERDARDKGRAVSPLEPAKDALVIDSTQMSIDAVLDRIHSEVLNRDLLDGV